MTEIKTNAIPHRLKNVNKEHPYIAGAVDIIDDNKNKTQATINAEVDAHFENVESHATDTDNDIESLDNRIHAVEEHESIMIEGGNLEVVNTGEDIQPGSGAVATGNALADAYGCLVENPEWIKVITDANGRILCGIKADGSVEWSIGIPTPVKTYIDNAIAEIKNGTEGTDLNGLNKIIAFLSEFSTSDTLKDLLDTKVDKEEGKSLIPTQYIQEVENPEFIKAVIDSVGNLLFWLRADDGSVDWAAGVPGPIKKYITEDDIKLIRMSSLEDSKEYLYALIDKNKNLILAVENDGNVYFGNKIPTQIKEYVDNALKGYSQDNDVFNSKIFFGGNDVIKKDSLGVVMQSNWGDRPYLQNLAPVFLEANLGIVRGCPTPGIYNFVNAGVTWLGDDFFVDDPNAPELLDDSGITHLVEQFVGTYNGIADIEYNGEIVHINVKYWQALNEVNSKWTGDTGKYSTSELFRCYKTFYKETKRVNPDAIVVFGPAAYDLNGCIAALAAYVDIDGWRFWDSFDIYAINYYTLGSIESEFKNLYNIMKSVYSTVYDKNFIDKPVWITEFNIPSYNGGDIKQANDVPKMYIKFLSYGIDKCLVYRFIDEGRMRASFEGNQRECYYGILRKNTTGSYVSFLRNDGEYDTAISVGSDLKRAYFTTEDVAYLSLKNSYSSSIVSELKENGLVISGKGYTLTGVILKKSDESEITIWTGNIVITDSDYRLILASSYFADVAEGDVILLSVTDIDNDNNLEWIEADPREVYYSLSFMSKILPEGVKKPNMINESNIHTAKWTLPNGNNVCAVWNEGSPATIRFNIEGDYIRFLDYKGNPLVIDDVTNYVISNEIIFILNYKTLKVKKL